MDADLAFLKKLDNDCLKALVDIIVEKGGITEGLTSSKEHEKYGDDYQKYVEKIEQEYRLYGSNSIATWLGAPREYKPILCDVAKLMKVNFNKTQSVEVIEDRLLTVVFDQIWDKMTEEQRAEMQNEMQVILDADTPNGMFNTGTGSSASLILIGLIRAGGFKAYKVTVILANAIVKAAIGRGLPLAVNAGLTKAVSIFAGPVGLALSTLWTAYDIAGPAYRVMIPCTILIAVYRRMYENQPQKMENQ